MAHSAASTVPATVRRNLLGTPIARVDASNRRNADRPRNLLTAETTKIPPIRRRQASKA